MTDCEHPKCHEAFKLCLAKKVSKKAVWIAIIAIGLPLLATGVKVWSRQEADHLRFAEKKDLVECEREQTELQSAVKHMKGDLEEIRHSQVEARKDIKEILRYLRDK